MSNFLIRIFGEKKLGSIKQYNLKKVRKETVLKLYKNLVLPTFLYGAENWILTAYLKRRIDAAKMKLLRSLAGYILYDHMRNEYIRTELEINTYYKLLKIIIKMV